MTEHRLDRIAFNLLFNGVLSFLIALILIALVLRVARVQRTSVKLYLLSLPFLKVAVDAARGLPPQSYVFTDLNFFALPEGLGRFLSADASFSPFGPMVSLRLGIAPAKEVATTLFSVAVPDVLYTWLHMHGAGRIALVILGACLAVSTARIFHRVIGWASFERRRRHDRRASETIARIPANLRRTVDVYLSHHHYGTPFTGGISRPYVCIPASAQQILEKEELAAALAHELCHVRNFDLLQGSLIQLLGDAFWFIPGYSLLRRRLERLRELAADAGAVKSGAAPAALASALVRLGSSSHALPAAAFCSALARRGSLLAERIEALTTHEPPPPLRRWQVITYVLFAFWISGLVLGATFGNNYSP